MFGVNRKKEETYDALAQQFQLTDSKLRGISKWPAAHILEHSRPGKILFKEICGMGKNAIEIGATIKKDLVLQVDGNSYDWYEAQEMLDDNI